MECNVSYSLFIHLGLCSSARYHKHFQILVLGPKHKIYMHGISNIVIIEDATLAHVYPHALSRINTNTHEYIHDFIFVSSSCEAGHFPWVCVIMTYYYCHQLLLLGEPYSRSNHCIVKLNTLTTQTLSTGTFILLKGLP